MQPDSVDEPVTYIEAHQTHQRRLQMRKANLEKHEDDFFGGTRKTAQFKVIQKFISKLKVDNKNYEAILSQLQTLNMSKYLEEVSNIIATSVNEKEIIFYAKVASKLNSEYQNIPNILIKDLNKSFNSCLQSSEDNKKRLKSLFLFTTQLFVCGFSFSYKQVIDMLKKVFKSGKNKKSNHPSELEGKLFIYWYSSCIFNTFLVSFSHIFTKKTPFWYQKWQAQGKEMQKFPEVMPVKMKEELTLFFTKYTNQCYQLLKQVCEKLKNYENELLQCLKKDGQFSKQTQRNYNDLIDKFIATRENFKFIAQSINENYQINILNIKITPTQQIIAKYINKAENAEIYEDQFQKQIYESIPQDIIDSEQKNPNEDSYKQFKIHLDNCKNVHDSNEIAREFSKINTKKFRKLLARDVLQYRKQYHLVTPYLCRVIAMINKKYRDIGQFVNQIIFNQYEKLKENTQNTFVINDKKSRYFKYICEFTKFGVIDSEKTMNCIDYLIDNLNGYNIELIVAVLQNVGRFLHLSENSANRFTFLMNKYENVIKKKSFPIFTSSQLINSINLLKPRKESEKKYKKQLTPIQIQAQQIISKCIIDQIDEIIQSIYHLIETDEGKKALQQELLKKIQEFDFINSYNYAYLLQQISEKDLSNYIVDRSIVNLQFYLLSGENQKTILWAKFIAELYKYKQLERSLLYSTINSIMKISNNETGVVNAICSILEACVGYLNSKKINRNNEKFMILVEFRRYMSKCKYIPMLEQFQVIEVLESYHPYISQIQISMLNNFISQIDEKMRKDNREYDYFLQFDKFLDRKNLLKKQQKISIAKQYRQSEEMEKKEDDLSEKPNSKLIQQSKAFQKELVDIMEETRKEYLSRIAKPLYLQKNIEKRKQKKKSGPTITLIGRSGSKFVRRDLPKDGVHQSKQ